MSTIVLPEAPAPQPAPPPAEVTRFVAIRANLLPDEIADARRVRFMIRKVGVGLVAVVALVICGYGVSAWQTSSAKGSLAAAERKSASLMNQQRKFAPLVLAQSQAASIKVELTKLMVGDLSWTSMLATLRKGAPAGMTITNVMGTTTVGAASTTTDAAAGGLGVLNRSGKEQVGTLTITGTAPDKNSVAAYIDALAKVPGLAAAFPASVTGQGGKLVFTANVIITADALGGRYAAPAQGGH
jgi:Tfp pilus assembly protein PilN